MFKIGVNWMPWVGEERILYASVSRSGGYEAQSRRR